MTTDLHFAIDITEGMDFKPEEGTQRLRPDKIRSLEGRIRSDLNALFNGHLSDEEMASLRPAPKLKARTYASAQYYKCISESNWVSSTGTICHVDHIVDDVDKFPQCLLTFTREFDRMRMALVITKDQDTGRETTNLYIFSTMKSMQSCAPLLTFAITGRGKSKVELLGDGRLAQKMLRTNFPDLDVNRLKSDKNYRNEQLQYFRDHVFGKK